jgi:predicted CopG family antitoxin
MQKMEKPNIMKNIAVNYTVYQKLKDLGRAGDSFNDVLTKILFQQQNPKGVLGK